MDKKAKEDQQANKENQKTSAQKSGITGLKRKPMGGLSSSLGGLKKK